MSDLTDVVFWSSKSAQPCISHRRINQDLELAGQFPLNTRRGKAMPVSSEAAADVAIIGAGPAGLTAAYLLTKAGISVIVTEKDPVYVGGISRTVEHEGFR